MEWKSSRSVQDIVGLAATAMIFGTMAFGIRAAIPHRMSTDCLTRNMQMAEAATAYAGDYDNRLAFTVVNGSGCVNTATEYYVEPYLGSVVPYRCPSDPNGGSASLGYCASGAKAVTIDQMFRSYAIRADRGYNWQYLRAPSTETIGAVLTTITNQDKMLMFVDSIWERNLLTGDPEGGGTGFVDPPARIYTDGSDSFPTPGTNLWWTGGWNPSKLLAWNVYGGCWPWHNDNGPTVNVIFVDGHTASLTIKQLAAGCDVQDAWKGFITDPDAYLWDLQ
jgi:prepilin-type processing-associated H-X9-DG protein